MILFKFFEYRVSVAMDVYCNYNPISHQSAEKAAGQGKISSILLQG
jgi:hypothetical protein